MASSTSSSASSSAGASSSKSTAAAAPTKGPGGDQQPSSTMVIVDNKDFDLKAYIGRYKGFTRVHRLSFIAERCPDHAGLAIETVLADFTSKQAGGPQAASAAPVGDSVALCTLLYKQVAERIAAVSGGVAGQPVFDQQWFDATERFCVGLQDKLEKDLNTARSTTEKEKIRVAHLALGDFFFRRGDFNMALKMYSRMRDQCITPAHINELYLRLIRCTFESKALSTIPGHVQKMSQTVDAKDLPLLATIKASSALSELETKAYKQAARKFAEVPLELGSSFNDVIAPEDVAVYGGICALATFDRNELKRMVLENAVFRQFLDTVPAVSNIINDFYRCEYSSCFKQLDKLKLDLLLDIHLYDHVPALLQKIRDKALVQYFTPYSTVDLKPMAEAFNTTVPELEKELSKLIVDGNLQARIDSQNKVLIARNTDQRVQLFRQALESGADAEEELRTSLLRLNLLRREFCVREKRAGGGGGRGGEDSMMPPHHLFRNFF